MSRLCPNQHASQTADFCSVCGAEMAPAPAAAAGEPCPQCGTPREAARQLYCEACGHDLRGAAPDIPLELAAPASRDGHHGRKPWSQRPEEAAPVHVRWDVVVRVDANLYGKPNADAP